MEDQGDEDDEHLVDNDDHENEPTEEVAWDFYGFLDSGHRDMTTFHVTRNVCTKNNAEESCSMVDSQAIIEEGIYFIPWVAALNKTLTETTEECLNDTKEHETVIARMND